MEHTISELTSTLVAIGWQRIDWGGDVRQHTPGSWTLMTPGEGQDWNPRLQIETPEGSELGLSIYVEYDLESGRLGIVEICNSDAYVLLTVGWWPGLPAIQAMLPMASTLWEAFWPDLIKWEDAQEP